MVSGAIVFVIENWQHLNVFLVALLALNLSALCTVTERAFVAEQFFDKLLGIHCQRLNRMWHKFQNMNNALNRLQVFVLESLQRHVDCGLLLHLQKSKWKDVSWNDVNAKYTHTHD